jgi:hypothetical protein
MTTFNDYDNYQYSLDYFSGAQATVSITNGTGKILLDEVTTLQWNEHQSKVPLYGYASQFFDQVAKGAVLVQGQFSINLVQPNYLLSVLRSGVYYDDNEHLNKNAEDTIQKLKDVVNSTDAARPTPGEIIATTQTLEGKNNPQEYFKYINDVVWGPSPEEKMMDPALDSTVRIDNLSYFQIEIDFNNEADPGYASGGYTIHNVCILGSAKTLVIDEQPVQEVYSFYASHVENS